MNLYTKQTYRYGKQTGYQRGKFVGTHGEINEESGMNRYKLLYIKQVNNKGLLYSTGNYIQYLVTNYNGKESEKIQRYILLNHFAVNQKLIQHCKLTILQLKRKKKKTSSN